MRPPSGVDGRAAIGADRQPAMASDDHQLVSRVLAGDEIAFLSLARRYHQAVVWVARLYVDEASAQATAVDAWRAVLDALPTWAAPGTLPGFVFAVVGSALRRTGATARSEPATSAATPMASGHRGPTARLLAAIDALPPLERALIAVRDVARCSADEACTALALSDADQRRLLQGARTTLAASVRAGQGRRLVSNHEPGPAPVTPCG